MASGRPMGFCLDNGGYGMTHQSWSDCDELASFELYLAHYRTRHEAASDFVNACQVLRHALVMPLGLDSSVDLQDHRYPKP
jgi:hypothetical protein